jgi:hypothetical protein
MIWAALGALLSLTVLTGAMPRRTSSLPKPCIFPVE